MPLEKYVSFATKSFSLPDICVRIRSVIDDPRSDADDIGRLIGLDPSLTAKVLRLANSSLFRFPSQVESIAKAISVIGGEALYNLVVAETANSAFKHFDPQSIQLDKHWNESVYCGMVAKYLARVMGIRGSERFFVMGILQNLSELVVAKHSLALHTAYINDDSNMRPSQKQMKHFGFTFSECSGTILEQWKLPLVLYYPVLHANDTARQASDTDVGILTLATRIAARQHEKYNYSDSELFSSEIANSVNVDVDTITNAITFADEETAKVAMLIQ